ncbi:MFS transporter [Dactylosporangium fulvum]|uniref:MFS transporter n=1 Tax=Dactylosporangium fulvum TaxID=53359 RepID=A0ABY5VPR7_9ACTN|nr:MFS transporter [Dactylosporangium fulvum]UWP78779.1 MFS transporter [Dactylosporangium fulvum]
MRTYRELFALPEFSALFATVSAQMAATTVSGIALGTLVYAATGSPLLSALSLFGASFAQVVGAATVLSAADRLRPRSALAGLALFTGLTTACLALPGLPVAAVFAVVLAQGLVGSVGGGVRYGLLAEIVPTGGYLLGRSLLNMSVGAMQICGFAIGGVLIAAITARGTLLAGAGLSLVAALVARFGLTARPPRAAVRPSVRETWRGNRRLWSSPARRAVFIGLWLPNGLIVGCEALFIPYSPASASVLFVAAALGMLAGDTLGGRFLPARWRRPLTTPVQVLLAAPYLLFVLEPAVPVAVGLVVVASVGYCGSLLLQDRLVALTPDDLRGQALGLHTSGMLTMQAVCATLAGTVAQFLAPGRAMAVLAVASILVSLALIPGLRAPVTIVGDGGDQAGPPGGRPGDRGDAGRRPAGRTA